MLELITSAIDQLDKSKITANKNENELNVNKLPENLAVSLATFHPPFNL
ncbi:hypothetical protein [Evansella vedderi]|nr:hypothetical protein [Evansella vedderi]